MRLDWCRNSINRAKDQWMSTPSHIRILEKCFVNVCSWPFSTGRASLAGCPGEKFTDCHDRQQSTCSVEKLGNVDL
jgi:hypothetical protein